MDAMQTIMGRHSCRAFLANVPAREQILSAVELASTAASSKNTQPWMLHLAVGEACNRVRQALLDAFDNGAPAGAEFRYSPDPMPGLLTERARQSGFALFTHKGIARDDKAARKAHDRENFRLFGAPAVAILTLPGSAERGTFLDAGQFLATFMLGLRTQGLESIPMFSVANYPAVLRSTMGLPEDRIVVCAIAFGQEDLSAPVNSFRTVRETPESLVTWA